MKLTIATLFLLLAPMAASAQALQDDTEQEPRRYTVEMIVFKYAQDIGSGGEVFVADPPADEVAASRDNSFTRLRRSDFTMGDIRARLNRLDAYRPVMHFGWTQTTYPAELTRSIRLSSLTAPAAGFDGTVKLYLSRFLHLVVDLQMDTEAERPADTFAPAAAISYRIQEDRIFRSGELRYFDHPKFGVLAKVSRVEEDDDAEAPDERELLGYPTQ
jgi:hypothetical protein